MADKLKEIPAKILEWWNKFTTRQKSIIVGAAAVVIFAFAIIMYVMSKPQYVRLITCETTSQASELLIMYPMTDCRSMLRAANRVRHTWHWVPQEMYRMR